MLFNLKYRQRVVRFASSQKSKKIQKYYNDHFFFLGDILCPLLLHVSCYDKEIEADFCVNLHERVS